ncbi:MAG: glycosyltransferase [Alphaproteobacteria bacterium]
MRVLVLTSSTGGGHDARAEAFRDWVERLHGSTVEVRIDHTLENSSPWFARGVAVYNAIQRRAPWFHHLYYNMGEVFGAFQRGEVRVGLPYYDSLLQEFQPDVVLSVHSMLNRGYFRYAKWRLAKPVFCVTYCGEFSGGYGFSRNWVAREVDFFLGRTEETLQAARQLGLPADKGKCLGHFLKPALYEPPMDTVQEVAYLRDRLDLDPGRFTLLLATGGAAAQNHIALLRQLLPFSERLQAIALCGRSVETRERLEAWQRRHPELGLAILPFSLEMDSLLQVASAVVTRPGTTTSAEALRLGCPILFNRIGGTMPQENCTLRYFEARNLAVSVRSPVELGRVLRAWLDRPLEYHRYRERFRGATTPDEPEALVQAILGPSLSHRPVNRTRRTVVDALHEARGK